MRSSRLAHAGQAAISTFGARSYSWNLQPGDVLQFSNLYHVTQANGDWEENSVLAPPRPSAIVASGPTLMVR